MNSEPDTGRPGDGEERRAPCLDEARRAAAALGEAGAARVLVYGSVGRGDQHADSDIDLVAIFDDLDYKKRREVKRDLSERAEEAVDRKVDVHPTDWPEWTMRTQNVSSSFETHIAGYAVVLWDREPGDVHWGKPMVKAASNLEQAREHTRDFSSNLAWGVKGKLEIFFEFPPRLVEQPRRLDDHERVGFFCRDAAFVLWRAVAALICLRGAYPPRLPRGLDFAGFVAALPPEVRAACAAWAGEVALIDVSGYESYCGDRWCCFPTAPGSETVEIARTLAGSAARAAIAVCKQMRPTLQDANDDADSPSRYWFQKVEKDAAEVLALLEQWNPPIAGAPQSATPAEATGAPRPGD